MNTRTISVKSLHDGCELSFNVDGNNHLFVLDNNTINLLVKNLLPLSDIPTQIQDIVDDVSFKTQMILKGKYER